MKYCYAITFLASLIFIQCDTQKPAQTTNDSKPEATTAFYSCYGNEPFWNIKMENEQIIFSSLDGGTVAYPYFPPRELNGMTVFQTRLQIDNTTSTLKITLKKEACMDAMSGKKYSYAVTIQKDRQQFKGCANYQ